MTISTIASTARFLGNDSTSTFDFDFVIGPATNAAVYFTDTNGTQTLLSPSQYTLFLNAPTTGALWGVGGTVTYPKSGPPLTDGQSVTITRIVPLTQLTSLSNQGAVFLSVIESALDTLCLEIQQIANRSGQFRGVWVACQQYNYGDIVQDGAAGANTGGYYFTTIANDSCVWATALANGEFVFASAAAPTAPGSSTDKAVVRWNGTNGNGLQNSTVIIQDNGTITGFRNDIITEAGTTFTLSESAHGARTTQTTNAGAVTVTCAKTVAAGVDGEIVQQGAGQVTFVAESGATIQNRQSQFNVAGQYGVVRWKVMTNSDGSSAVYSIAGDTA